MVRHNVTWPTDIHIAHVQGESWAIGPLINQCQPSYSWAFEGSHEIMLGVLRNLGGVSTRLPAPTNGSPLPRVLYTCLHFRQSRPRQFLIAREDAILEEPELYTTARLL